MSTVGEIAAGILVPPAVLSCFLPSPSTAYDKASGEISSGPKSMALLRRSEIIGAAISVGVAAALALVAADELGPNAAWIFVGAVALLGLFVFEYNRALRLGQEDAKAEAS